MIELFRTENRNLHEKVKILLARRIGTDFQICKNPNGKPYVAGNPVYFSLSHSRDLALIALCDSPVGVDLEIHDSTRKFRHVLSRFTENEREEIGGEFCFFVQNWTMKEAYIKMTGGSLARDLKRLEYYGGRLYLDGRPADCGYVAESDRPAGMTYAVCAEGTSFGQCSAVPFQQFRLQKGENFYDKR